MIVIYTLLARVVRPCCLHDSILIPIVITQLENFMCVDKTSDTKIKVIDFGYAKRRDQGLVTNLGTPAYTGKLRVE